MIYKKEYSNVYSCDLSFSTIEWLNNVVNTILINDVDYVDFTVTSLQHNLLASRIANDFIHTNKQALTKNEYVVVSTKLEDRLLAVSIGSITNEGHTEYTWGILSK